jgi:uncharacterized RDD family membrane protein YckC
MNDGSNPFQPPTAVVADVAAEATELATRGNRFLAALVDVVIQVAVLWLASLVLPWQIFDPDPSVAETAATGAISLALFLALHGWLLVRDGQTLGKKLLGVRIVRPDGSRADARRLLGLRYGIGWLLTLVPVAGPIYALLDALFIFRRDRRCLHDLIAGTIVVRA